MNPIMSRHEPKPRLTWSRSPWADLWRLLRLTGTVGVILGIIAVVVLAAVGRDSLTMVVWGVSMILGLAALPFGFFFFAVLRIIAYQDARDLGYRVVPPKLTAKPRWEQVFLGIGVPLTITFVFISVWPLARGETLF